MPYRIEIKRSALKELAELPLGVRRRVVEAIDQLAGEPRPAGCRKLVGADDLWRVRAGDYRVIYRLRDEVLLVLVVRIGHRREVYR